MNLRGYELVIYELQRDWALASKWLHIFLPLWPLSASDDIFSSNNKRQTSIQCGLFVSPGERERERESDYRADESISTTTHNEHSRPIFYSIAFTRILSVEEKHNESVACRQIQLIHPSDNQPVNCAGQLCRPLQSRCPSSKQPEEHDWRHLLCPLFGPDRQASRQIDWRQSAKLSWKWSEKVACQWPRQCRSIRCNILSCEPLSSASQNRHLKQERPSNFWRL